MAKSLRFEGATELRKLSAAADIESDEARGALHVTARLSVLIESNVNQVLGQFFEDRSTVKALGGLLWRTTGGVRETGLGGFSLKGVYGGQSMRMASGNSEVHLENVTVRKVNILPFGGRCVALRFEISAPVESAEWEWLRGALVHGAITVAFEAPRQRDPIDDLEHLEEG